MAAISPQNLAIRNANGKRVLWETLTTTNDVGTAVQHNDFADRSVQVIGTFGAGGALAIEGSNDGGVTWKVLTDPQGNALTFSAAGIEAITEVTWMIRPHVTGGDGTTDLDVHLFLAGGMK